MSRPSPTSRRQIVPVIRVPIEPSIFHESLGTVYNGYENYAPFVNEPYYCPPCNYGTQLDQELGLAIIRKAKGLLAGKSLKLINLEEELHQVIVNFSSQNVSKMDAQSVTFFCGALLNSVSAILAKIQNLHLTTQNVPQAIPQTDVPQDAIPQPSFPVTNIPQTSQNIPQNSIPSVNANPIHKPSVFSRASSFIHHSGPAAASPQPPMPPQNSIPQNGTHHGMFSRSVSMFHHNANPSTPNVPITPNSTPQAHHGIISNLLHRNSNP